MKQIFLLLLIIASTSYSRAQSYVEVAVSDTVIVKADEFIVQLMAMPHMEIEYVDTVAPARSRTDYMRTEQQMRRRQQQILDAVENKLRNMGFKALPAGIQNLMQGTAYGNQLLTYQLSSPEELSRFRSAVENERAINLMLVSVTGKQEESRRQELYQKLMRIARSRAESLARISNKKITGVMLISEVVSPEIGVWSYPRRMDLPPAPAVPVSPGIQTDYTVPGRLIVRFSWE